MQEKLWKDFFSSVHTGEPTFTVPVIIALQALLVLGVLGTALWYRKFPDSQRFLKVIAGLQLVEFLSVNIWYRVAGYLAYPLPLYHCRLAKILLILFAFLPRKTRRTLRPLFIYAVVMAFFGPISSFVYPNPDPFQWPHITLVSYFFGHFNLIVFAMAYMMEDELRWTWKDLVHSQILLLVFNLGILVVARQTQTNYSYLLESPLFNAKLQAFGPTVFVVIMFAVYAILYSVSFFIMKSIEHKAKKEIFLNRELLVASKETM